MNSLDMALLKDLLVINHNREIVEHIREYVDIMKDEPAHELIEVQRVYHDLRRMLGDEI